MRHARPYRKLSRQRSHYRALMRNLAFSLFEHERITTTFAKAKEARAFVDHIIGLGKQGTLHSRRRAMALMGNKIMHLAGGKKVDIVGKVFDDLAKRYKTRAGGYTRILKLAKVRAGDAASMVIFELVDRVEKAAKKAKTEATTGEEKPAKAPKAPKAPKAAKAPKETKAKTTSAKTKRKEKVPNA